MTIQEILEAHDGILMPMMHEDYVLRCVCGHELHGLQAEAHRAHVAEVLDKHMNEGARQAQVNVLNGVASAWEEMALPGANHLYARMLREAANRIGGEPNGR